MCFLSNKHCANVPLSLNCLSRVATKNAPALCAEACLCSVARSEAHASRLISIMGCPRSIHSRRMNCRHCCSARTLRAWWRAWRGDYQADHFPTPPSVARSLPFLWCVSPVSCMSSCLSLDIVTLLYYYLLSLVYVEALCRVLHPHALQGVVGIVAVVALRGHGALYARGAAPYRIVVKDHHHPRLSR